MLPRADLAVVERQIARGVLSLQRLARRLKTKRRRFWAGNPAKALAKVPGHLEQESCKFSRGVIPVNHAFHRVWSGGVYAYEVQGEAVQHRGVAAAVVQADGMVGRGAV